MARKPEESRKRNADLRRRAENHRDEDDETPSVDRVETSAGEVSQQQDRMTWSGFYSPSNAG